MQMYNLMKYRYQANQHKMNDVRDLVFSKKKKILKDLLIGRLLYKGL